jgi:hypothetical protein
MKKIILPLFLVIALLHACTNRNGNTQGYHQGSTVKLGSGEASSWIRVGKNEKPIAIGIRFSTSVLDQLGKDNRIGDMPTNTIFLTLPEVKNLTPFNQIGVNWKPLGKEGYTSFRKPLFHFSFRLMSASEEQQSSNNTSNASQATNMPVPGFLPGVYVLCEGEENEMVSHWMDRRSPELDPANEMSFTQAFMYGFYKGKVTAYEPVITLDFLRNTRGFTRNIPQPEKFAKSGFYPTKMTVERTNGYVHVILEGFLYREQSPIGSTI